MKVIKQLKATNYKDFKKKGMLNYLMRDDEFMMGIVSIFSLIMSLVYLLPLFQALFAYEKKKWLEKQLSLADYNDSVSANAKAKLLASAEPGQSYPLYKLFKFYFATLGIAGIIIGLLVMILPSDLGKDAINWMLFLPLIIGVGIYFLYTAMFKGQGLWREIAAVFLFVGFASTAGMAYGNFEMYSWLRADILCYIILAVGFFVIMHLKSTMVSFLYMITVIISGGVSLGVENNWLMFLSHFVWFFAIAILYIWIPRLKAAKDVGPTEIVFGILFAAMMLSLTFTHTAGLIIPSLAIVLPGLYIFGKAYFKTSTSFISRPIEIIVGTLIIILAAAMSTNMGMTFISDSIYLFKGYSFHKQFVYLILVGLAYGVYYIYDNDLNDAEDEVNPLIAVFPVAAFLIAYIIGEYGGHYLMTIFLLAMGVQFIMKGIDKKDAIRVGIGATVLVTTLIIKITDIFQTMIVEQMMEGGKFIVGFLIFFYSAIVLATVVYIRSQWTVTDENAHENSNEFSKENTEVIDNINLDPPTAE
jgi:isoprenylcysteine carboxyl methyltransferase (ICMT) family protein YpbQ